MSISTAPSFSTDGLAPPCTRNPEAFTQDCRTVGVTRRQKARVERAAQAVCATCPLQRPCAQWALDNHEPGVWGGTTDAQRAWLRRRGVTHVPRY